MLDHYPITTDCPDCQALVDARVLFMRVEAIAKRADMAPERMIRALREVLAMWVDVTVHVCGPEGAGLTVEQEIERLASEAAHAIRAHHARSQQPRGQVLRHTH